jgi:cytochrome P450
VLGSDRCDERRTDNREVVVAVVVVRHSDEDIIREFTIKQHEKFPKAYKDYEVLRFWGENIVTAPSEGYEWKKHRALLSPAFSSGNLRLVAKVTVDNTNTLFAKWDQQLKSTEMGEVADVHVDEDTMRVRSASASLPSHAPSSCQ